MRPIRPTLVVGCAIFALSAFLTWPTRPTANATGEDKSAAAGADSKSSKLLLHERRRVETSPGSGKFRVQESQVEWDPTQTAIIVCDMWNQHWCQGATARVAEMAPRMNEVLKAARARGVFIIHCPSDTMKFYHDAPQRKLAQAAPKVEMKGTPNGWCPQGEKEPPLPFDNSKDRCDCSPQCPHGNPWRRQIDTLEIAENDAITDNDEAYYLMRARNISNVIVMGVHTNMCVLGRPFSIRRMCGQGQNVVLCRDLTDSMHDSLSPPAGLDHFRATDLVIEHIEKYWCPSITSADLLAGGPFSFREDKRPSVVLLIGEDEYETKDTLPPFADEELTPRGLRVTTIHSSKNDPNDFRGVEALKNADLMLVSVRRRTPPAEQLAIIRDFVTAGKPVVGIRTASHAFSLRDNREPPAGHSAWPEFDAQVLGGHYTGHLSTAKENEPSAFLKIVPQEESNPILAGLTKEFSTHYSLYKTRPLAKTATPLVMGRAEEQAEQEPVAWTNKPVGGNRVFYTSLGGKTDFDLPEFRRLLTNGIFWALDKPVPKPMGYAPSTAGGR